MHSPFVKTRKLSSPKDDLCQVWLELACGSGEKDFKMFSQFRYFLLLEMGLVFHSHIFEFHSPKILCAMFGCNWPNHPAEEVGIVSVYRQAEGGTDRVSGKLRCSGELTRCGTFRNTIHDIVVNLDQP